MTHVSLKNKKSDTLLSFARLCRILFSVFIVMVLWNCASLSRNGVLAVVDDEMITREDLAYSLQIEHRREDLSSARKLDIPEYIQKIIDEKLMVQEARRMGIEEFPEIKNKVQDYLLREAVMKLYNDEIVRKVSVTDKEIKDDYKKNYERVSLEIIAVDAEKEAKEILEKLKAGDEFSVLVGQYSKHPTQKTGGNITLPIKDTGLLREAIASLKPGEISDILKVEETFYIIKFISREEAPDGDFDQASGSIKKGIESRKIEERSTEYLSQLRNDSGLKIDQELLSSIDLEGGKEEREKWLADKRTLVDVNGSILSVGDFVAMLPQGNNKSIKSSLNSWIDRKVVDNEALARHYETTTDLKEMLKRYKDQLLKSAFINRVIMTKIDLSEKDIEDYYLKHQKDYIAPVSYKIQQITLKTREEAEDTLKSLHNGANFTWLAKNRSADPYASDGGNAGWLETGQLPDNARDIVSSLEPGGISPVIEVDSLYRIIRLQERSGGEFKKLENVKPLVQRGVFGEKYAEIYSKYIDELKRNAKIIIYDENVRAFEKMFEK